MAHFDTGLRRGFLLSKNPEWKVPTENGPFHRKAKPKPKPTNPLGMTSGFLLKGSAQRALPKQKDKAPTTTTTTTSSSQRSSSPQSTASSVRRHSSHPKPRGSGMSKGFLLSKPIQTPKRRKSDSRTTETENPPRSMLGRPCQDLLELENPSESSHSNKPSFSLFVLDESAETNVESEGVDNSRSVHVESHGSWMAEREMGAPKPRSLISVIDGDPDNRAEGWGDESTTDNPKVPTMGPNLHEPPSCLVPLDGNGDIHEIGIRAHPAEHGTKSLFQPESRSGSKGVDRSMTFLEFQQVLLNRNWEDHDVSDWSSNHVSWAWQWLLRRPRASVVRLSELLLHRHPQSVRDFLAPQTQEDRALSLQMLQGIQNFLSKEDVPLQFLDTWINQILVDLAMLADQSKRTVLANEAWIASILVIDRLCMQWNGATCTLQETTERLLRTQLRWKLDKERKDAKSDAWIFLIQEWNEVSENYRGHSSTGAWQMLVTGCPVEEKGCHWGGLKHLFCPDKCAWTPLRTGVLAGVWDALCQDNEDSHSETCHRTILLRGLLAELVLTKTQSSSVRKEIIENVLGIFPHLRTKTECTFAVEMLRVILSTTTGVPTDLEPPIGPGYPKLIQRILSILPRRLSQDDKWNEMDSLSFFVAGYVAKSENCRGMIETFANEQALTPFIVKVLCDILSLQASNADVDPSGSAEVRCLIQDTFLARLVESPSIRGYLASSESSFFWRNMGSARITTITEKLLRLLMNSTDLCGTLHVEIQSVVSSSIAIMTKLCLSEGTQLSLIGVMATVVCDESSSSDEKDRQHHVLISIGATLREELLGQLSIPETHFGDLVLASAQEVLLNPSSTAALTVFGSILGQEMPDFVHSMNHADTRIYLAMHYLIELCSNGLETCFTVKENDYSVFQRLAPLLLLRRVPKQYFLKAGMVTITKGDVNDVQKGITILASQLARILGCTDGTVNATPHECRLAAEVAGRLLKFGRSPSSAFQLICSPFFSKIGIKSGKGILGSDDIETIQKARLALYVACCSLQPSGNMFKERPYEEYCNVASFALLVLEVNVDETNDTVRSELVQLQTGCIEYFTICLMKVYQQPYCANKDRRDATPFECIYRAIQNLLKNGCPDSDDEWIVGGVSNFVPTSDAAPKNIGNQAQICLWNALSLVAQRLEISDGSLESFAQTNAWIVDWTQNERHPMVAAAAMQTIFITLTRLKGLSCFGDYQGTVATVLHAWALEVLQGDSDKAGSSPNALRMAALKLILCLLSVERANSGGSLLESPARLGMTLNVIERLSQTDPSTEIRTLSMQILRIC